MKSWKAARITGTRQDVLQFMLQLDDLAFVRRWRSVEESWRQLLAQCRQRRFQMLQVARVRLGILHALIQGDWDRLAPHLQDPLDAAYLGSLFDGWQPALRAPVQPTSATRRICRSLGDVVSSLHRFNANWARTAHSIDLGSVHRAREDYNRYYVVEKACALGSEEIARAGFTPLEPLSIEDVLGEFPPLHVPQLR